MTYAEALDYLYQFVNYERKVADTYAPEKMDPHRPERLLSLLGDPHRQFPAIHIAGTKGKGSVAAMCAFCLRAAGLRVGLYTSPHLQEFRERIRILTPDDADGRVSTAAFAGYVQQLRDVVPDVPGITWFELVTATGFMHFAHAGVDVAVVEVGLGGRLDATNVVRPLVSVITSLSLDHTALLGNTVEAIAAEKGGIIKPGVPVISAPQPAGAKSVLLDIARHLKAPFIDAGRAWAYRGETDGASGNQITITQTPDPAFVPVGTQFRLSLAGHFQQQNGIVAIAALCAARPAIPTLNLAAIQQGLAGVQWPGRLQTIRMKPGEPHLIADSAHNPAAAQRLVETLKNDFAYARLWLVLGMTADKDVSGIVQALAPHAAGLFITQADHPRALAPAGFAELIKKAGYPIAGQGALIDMVEAAWHRAGSDDLICVTGSSFVVGDLLNYGDRLQSALTRLQHVR